MNLALASYYGLVDFEKVSGASRPDISELASLRLLYDKYGKQLDLQKASSQDAGVARAIKVLGGPRAAAQKLSQSQDWLKAWADGEAEGVTLAHNVVEHQIEQIRAAHRGQRVGILPSSS